MTELEKCMENLIIIFHRYAKEDGDGKTLNKKELKKLVENELPSFIKVRIFYEIGSLSSKAFQQITKTIIWTLFSHCNLGNSLSEPEQPKHCG